ncbi:MAG: hypothetical protein AABM43_05845 [Actinomycetota bacterium]
MRPRLLATLTIAAAAAALLLVAPAQADFQTLYDDYRADGVIDGCAYSASELGSGLTDIPADVREYDPGFTDAINAALEQIATGCGTAPAAAATKNEVAAADGSPGPAAPHPLAVHAAETGPALPGVLAALIVVLGAALATAAVVAVRRHRSASNL